jgi:hypothetical protein
MAKLGRLELRVSVELLGRVDAARGDVSRTRWVERAIEARLDAGAVSGSGPVGPDCDVRAVPSPGSRAPAVASSERAVPARLGKGLVPARPKGL